MRDTESLTVRSAKLFPCAVYLTCLVFAVGCQSSRYADQGAALGGIAGAITGAALGDHNGNAAAGAIVGTALGVMTGAAVGESMDAELDHRQALIEQRTGRKMLGQVTTMDVMTLAGSGISDDVIANHIRANGVAEKLTPSDIIELHENGVSEKVINTMQQTAAKQATVVMASRERPVIIEEHYVTPPYWYSRPSYHRHRHHSYVPRRSGVSWGVSFAN